MQIWVNSIQKNDIDFAKQIEEYIKMSSKFATIKDEICFSSAIAKAQNSSKQEALRAYDSAYENKFKGYTIALDEHGEMLNSMEFAKMINEKSSISFFIGGAYGLSENFRSKVDKIVSLSRLTTSHKIAKLMLFEQIFRALSINANHPYHK